MITLTNFATRWKKEFTKNPSKFPELQNYLDLKRHRFDDAINDIERGQIKSDLLKKSLKEKGYKNFLNPGFNKNEKINWNRVERIDQLKKNIKNKALKKEQISKLKKAILNKKTLGVGALVLGAGIAANKLRKARSDKGRKRGNYNK